MTTQLDSEALGGLLEGLVEGSVETFDDSAVWIRPEFLFQSARSLRDAVGLSFDFLISITAVDYVDHFELVYHLTSTRYNHSVVVKSRLYERDDPAAPSVIQIWRGADFQEREVWDLMGIRFDGHPNLKRILLWEGFQGHPLRRDFLEPPLPYTWPQGG